MPAAIPTHTHTDMQTDRWRYVDVRTDEQTDSSLTSRRSNRTVFAAYGYQTSELAGGVLGVKTATPK